MNRNSNFITDIEKNKFTPVKEVKQFDNVRLSYELFANGDELDVTGSNISIRVLKADNTVVIQNTGFTINKNKVTLDLNNEVTKVAGIANIEIKVTKNNEQITTFATKLDIEKSVLNEVYAKKNLVEILVELDTKLNIANDRTSKLDTKNALAQTNINNLDARNNTATTKIRDLDSRNATATTNINNLDTKNNEAVTNKNSLYTENSVAQMHLDELKKKTEVATNTKEELNQFINNNKDMSKIHERINNNAKEITNLKDSIAQNRPIVIAEDTPIGSIVWYASEKILGKVDPDVWRVCNGQTLNKADFPDLYELIKDNPNYTKTETTFNLPDLISSKRFIRAVGDSYNVGYVENDELKSHRHFLVNSKGKFFEISGSSAIGAANNAVDTFFVSGATKPNKVGYTNEGEAWMYATCTNYVGGDETRPKNIQFIPLIKCKCRAKDIVDLATDVEQAKAGFNTLKEAMDSKATKESIAEITEEISNVEEAILDINNELEEARNGEVSLDARIEKDINKINDNIDNLSFLPFEGENIDVNNSLNGYTRDLVIKGKTLQNLYIGNRENTFTISQGQHYNHLTLCETSMLKLNTPYTIYFDIEIISNTTIGNIGDNFIAELGIANNLNSVEGHPTVASGKYNITPIYNTNKNVFTFTDFKGHKYLAIRPLLPPLRPVPTGQQISYKIKNIIILEGDYTNKSTPNYFEGIKSVGELEENKISILSNNKNICNDKNFELGNYSSNGKPIGNPTGGTTYKRTKERIKIKPYTKYSISFKAEERKIGVFTYNNNDSFVRGIYDLSAESFTTYSHEKYLRFRIIDTATDIQIEEGNKTEYKPYKDDKKDILLPFTDGLKSLPNGVSDEIKYLDNKYKIIQKVSKLTIDGTENWIDYKSNDTYIAFYIPLSIKSESSAISNKLKNDWQSVYNLTGEAFWCEANNNRLFISVSKARLISPDKAGFKKWLKDEFDKGDSLTIYYEALEDIIHNLDKDLNLEVYKDKTYISSNNTIQPVISCKVPTDVQATISTLRENNKELEEENIKLKEVSYKNEATNYIQQIDIDNNQMATVELFEMLIGGINTFKIKGGDNGMVEVYVSLILKGKKTLDEVSSMIRPKVEAMLKDLGAEL